MKPPIQRPRRTASADAGHRMRDPEFMVMGSAGYGFAIALVSLVGWPGASSSLACGQACAAFDTAKNVSYCLSFLVWFVAAFRAGRQLDRLLMRAGTYAAFPAMTSAGILAPFVAGPAGMQTAASIAQGVLLGCGVAGSFALWQRALCARATPYDARALIGGTVFGGMLYFVLTRLPEAADSLIAATVVSPGAGALLFACSRGVAAQESVSRDEHSDLRIGLFSLAMPCLTIGAIGFAMQYVRIAIERVGGSDAFVGDLLSGALIVGAAALFVLFEKTRYRIDMNIFYRVFAPLLALAFVALAFAGTDYASAVVAACYIVFDIASIMAILACAQIARRYRIGPIAIYALAFFAIYTMRYAPAFAARVLETAGADLAGCFSYGGGALAVPCLMFAVYVGSDRFLDHQRKADIYSWKSLLPDTQKPIVASSVEDINELGRRFRLTQREMEVLVKLREGRSVPYIAETLYVAENTVKYHCKNIYKKLGVHTRQELFDLIDTIWNP